MKHLLFPTDPNDHLISTARAVGTRFNRWNRPKPCTELFGIISSGEYVRQSSSKSRSRVKIYIVSFKCNAICDTNTKLSDVNIRLFLLLFTRAKLDGHSELLQIFHYCSTILFKKREMRAKMNTSYCEQCQNQVKSCKTFHAIS